MYVFVISFVFQPGYSNSMESLYTKALQLQEGLLRTTQYNGYKRKKIEPT